MDGPGQITSCSATGWKKYPFNILPALGSKSTVFEFSPLCEIKPSTECTYLGTKIDQMGDNTTEIKHTINQTRKAINALNSIWWHKDIQKTENYIFIKQ